MFCRNFIFPLSATSIWTVTDTVFVLYSCFAQTVFFFYLQLLLHCILHCIFIVFLFCPDCTLLLLQLLLHCNLNCILFCRNCILLLFATSIWTETDTVFVLYSCFAQTIFYFYLQLLLYCNLHCICIWEDKYLYCILVLTKLYSTFICNCCYTVNYTVFVLKKTSICIVFLLCPNCTLLLSATGAALLPTVGSVIEYFVL